jgi:hypothetical protein
MYSLPEKWTVGILLALLSNFFSSARTLRSSFLMRHPLRTIIHDLQSCLHFRVYLRSFAVKKICKESALRGRIALP